MKITYEEYYRPNQYDLSYKLEAEAAGVNMRAVASTKKGCAECLCAKIDSRMRQLLELRQTIYTTYVKAE